jgi:hypothetical protein
MRRVRRSTIEKPAAITLARHLFGRVEVRIEPGAQ